MYFKNIIIIIIITICLNKRTSLKFRNLKLCQLPSICMCISCLAYTIHTMPHFPK